MDSRKTASQSDKESRATEVPAIEVNGIKHVVKKDTIKNYKLWVLMDLVGCMHDHKSNYFSALQS